MAYELVVQKGNTIERVALLSSKIVGNHQLLDRHRGVVTPPVGNGTVQIEAIGGGGYGSVFQALDPIGLPRALKIMQYKAVYTDVPDVHPLKQEIQLTGEQSFKNVLPILTYAESKDLENYEFIYYTMPLVEGYDIDKFFSRLLEEHRASISKPTARRLMRDIFLQVVGNAVDGLIELHQADIAHLDVSPSNVMVSLPRLGKNLELKDVLSRARGILIDLGSARRISKERTGKTLLFFKAEFFPENAFLELITDKFTTSTTYELLAPKAKQLDLFAFGRTLEWIVLDRGQTKNPSFMKRTPEGSPLRIAELAKQEYWEDILDHDFTFIHDLIGDLLDFSNPRIQTATRLKELLNTLEPDHGPTVFGSALLTDKHAPLRIPAGSTLASLTSPAIELVSHPTFQRLRRIQQLGMLSEVFAGATHTRFAHSLQVFELTKRYLRSLARVSEFRREFQRPQVDETLIAALLHDCGQYPFAHTLEDLRKMANQVAIRLSRPGKIDDESLRLERLEQLSALQAIEHDQDLAVSYMQKLERIDGKSRSIAEILEANEISLENVRYIIAKTDKDFSLPRHLNIARDIVSGIIDADRLSYLRYDAEQTGVPYGKAVDTDLLVDSLTVRTSPRNEVGLGIESKGVPAAEAVSAALYWMYQNVYWHRSNRGFMAAIKFVVARLLMNGRTTFQKYADVIYGQSDLFALIWLADQYDAFLGKNDGQLSNPLRGLVNRERFGFVCVYELNMSESLLEKRDDTSISGTEMYGRIVRGIDPWREVELIDAVNAAAGSPVSSNDGEILIDVPLKPRQPGNPDSSTASLSGSELGAARSVIWVRKRRLGTDTHLGWMSLYDYSALARAYQAEEHRTGMVIRVFISRRLNKNLTLRNRNGLPAAIHREFSATVSGWKDD